MGLRNETRYIIVKLGFVPNYDSKGISLLWQNVK